MCEALHKVYDVSVCDGLQAISGLNTVQNIPLLLIDALIKLNVIALVSIKIRALTIAKRGMVDACCV